MPESKSEVKSIIMSTSKISPGAQFSLGLWELPAMNVVKHARIDQSIVPHPPENNKAVTASSAL